MFAHPTIHFKRVFTVLLLVLIPLTSNSALAASAQEINIRVDATLQQFRANVMGGDTFLKSAKGVLVFPDVIKAGVGIGGEYGEGALRINDQTRDFYSTAAASIGFQLGAQSKSIVLVFMSNEALQDFRNNRGWKAGVDGSVALIEWSAARDINTLDIKDPIVGFVFNNKGLMYNLTLEGSKFTKISR